MMPRRMPASETRLAGGWVSRFRAITASNAAPTVSPRNNFIATKGDFYYPKIRGVATI